MRVMVLVKASEESEAGAMPGEALLTEMGRFNEQLVAAGKLLAGEGLHPSSKGVRVRYSTKAAARIVDGPFAESKELIAGYWLWQVDSIEDAIDWARRCPMGDGAEVEIRPVFEAEDFGAGFTPELREQEARVRSEAASKQLGTN